MKKHPGLTSAALHITAMALMLSDHLWATVLPAQNFLTCIGRIAFPIFAFMLVEGYYHTRDVKRYLLRLLLFALISEIPFDLMYAGTVFYPFHQNVLWTFLIALSGICLIERSKGKGARHILISVACVFLSFLVGTLGMVDYYGAGVLTVYVFYFFREKKPLSLLLQLLLLYWINVEILGGQYYIFTFFGHKFEICEQGLALLSLIPIWLYNGRQGHSSRAFRTFCYAFYPLHMLLLCFAVRLM